MFYLRKNIYKKYELRITDPRMFQSSSFFFVCYGNEIKYHIALLVAWVFWDDDANDDDDDVCSI